MAPAGTAEAAGPALGSRVDAAPAPLERPRASASRLPRRRSAAVAASPLDDLGGGIRRLTLPLPTGPRHVHCYLVDGLLVDTGLGFDPPDWRALPIDEIVITHFHPDHVGGAEAAAVATGAPVVEGRLDYAQCERVWGSADWPEQMAAWFAQSGVPEDETALLLEEGHAFAPFIRYAPNPRVVDAGAVVREWEVHCMPGHADGHICLLRDGVLLAGDHLLAEITPAIGLYPDSRPDPLGDYLESLERTVELDPRIAYGGHGDPVFDPAARARVLIAHHTHRLEETRVALSPVPQTAFAVSCTLFGRDLRPTVRRFAVAETLSHLERLVRTGAAARDEGDRFLTYTAA